MRHRLRFALAFSLLAAPSLPAWAQPRPAPRYEGVTPGAPNPPPALGRLRAPLRGGPSAILTWPGFVRLPDGGSRFFVQTTGPVSTEMRVSAERIEVVFPRTAVHVANSRRWLETRHFDTPVLRARLERRGRDMVLVMILRAARTPRISAGPGEGGFHYTYIDFEPGRFLPPEPAPSPGGSVGVVGVGAGPAPRRDPLDDERPPPIQGPAP